MNAVVPLAQKTGTRSPGRRRRAAPPSAAPPAPVVAADLLDALPDAVMALDRDDRIAAVNQAAEAFWGLGAASLVGQRLATLVAPSSPLLALVGQVRRGHDEAADSGLLLDLPRLGPRLVAVRAAPLGRDGIALSLRDRTLAERLDRQLGQRQAVRSVAAVAALLAHEIKNPLAGIRAAAQLLEEDAEPEARALTTLIREEIDRVTALLARVEMFVDDGPPPLGPVNIHEVLTRVRTLAQSGFARHVRFVEQYDPSLPPVLGNRDLLVRALLNLVKNAAEASRDGEATSEIALGTAFQPGLRLAVGAVRERRHLPLLVTVTDNGPGIPEALLPNLFEPFGTTKADGTGLGLAYVAKIVGDHGGTIECDSRPRRTVFRLSLPLAAGAPGDGGAA